MKEQTELILTWLRVFLTILNQTFDFMT